MPQEARKDSANQELDRVVLTREQKRARRNRNIAIALALAAFVVIVYVGTWAKMGAAIFNRDL